MNVKGIASACFEDEFGYEFGDSCSKEFRPLYRIKGQNLNSAKEDVEDNP